ncbi:MAG: ABC transporter substrate-binding protein [Thermoprotei archaeon]
MSWKKAISRSAIIGIVIVIIIIIIGAAYMLLYAPGGATPTTTTTTTTMVTTTATTTTTTTPPKPLVIGVTDKVTDIDPASAYDFYTWEVLNNIMAGLVTYKPGTADIQLALASSYTIKNNGLTYVFTLRDNLKFSDGSPLTAQDFVRSINRVVKINAPEGPGWLITSFVNNVTAPDSKTVVFNLKQPVSYFLALLATPPYFAVSPKYNPNAVDSDQTAGGAGAYRITKWVRDQELDLEANPYFYNGTPYISKVIIRFYKDATSLRAALESGEVDIAWRTLNPIDIMNLKSNPNVNVIQVPGAFIRYIIFNTQTSPVNNVLVRRALAAIINRTDIAQRVYTGTVTPLYSLVPIGMWSYTPVFKQYYGDANLTYAKQLLSQAGYSTYNKLSIDLWYTPTHYGSTEASLAQVLKEQWESTGMISVNIKSAEWSTYVKQASNGTMMISLFGWYPDYLDPDDYLTPFLHSEANTWTGSHYSNATVNQLLTQAQSLTDISQRTQIYQKVQRMLGTDVPFIPLVQGQLTVVAKKGISGIILGPDMLFRYWLVRWG